MTPDSVRISDGNGHWIDIDPATPFVPAPPVGIPADRVHVFLGQVEAGTGGHLADPTGTGQGRWLATPPRMIRTEER